jgi:tetratricopeptide (TPR) repeat protein
VRALYLLAESYREIARTVNQEWISAKDKSPPNAEHYQKENREWLNKAIDKYKELCNAFDQGQLAPAGRDSQPLATEEMIRALTNLADGQFSLAKTPEEYADALLSYQKLGTLCKGRKEQGLALANGIRRLIAMNKKDELKKWCADLRTLLPTFEAGHSLSAEETFQVLNSLAEGQISFAKQPDEFQEAMASFEKLAELCKGQKEQVLGLAGVVRCLTSLDRKDEARKRLEEIQSLLPALSEERRADWERWIGFVLTKLNAAQPVPGSTGARTSQD